MFSGVLELLIEILPKGNLALLGDFFEGWFAKLQPCIFSRVTSRCSVTSSKDGLQSYSPVSLISNPSVDTIRRTARENTTKQNHLSNYIFTHLQTIFSHTSKQTFISPRIPAKGRCFSRAPPAVNH
jgi:hypothetical protein